MKRIKLQLGPIVLVVAVFISLAVFLATLSSGPSVFNYIFTGSSLNSSDGRVNVLLLGIAGGTHAGSNLTDTIIVASYNLRTKQAHLISIPRDLWMPSLAAKANAVYGIGFEEDGLEFVKTVFGNVVGLPIHYVLRMDFRGFIKAADLVGGIDVLVDRSFDDYYYPIEGKENDLCGWQEVEREFSESGAKILNIEPGKRLVIIDPEGKIATDSAQEERGIQYFSCRYEHVSFKKGLTHMDGQTALKFVRSRHGTNEEGSDFARSRRQQKVLEAAKKKLLSFETFRDPQRIKELLHAFGKSIDTDISAVDTLEFYRLLVKLESTKSIVLDDSLLFHPSPKDFGGAYVLVSQDDDFSKVHSYVRNMLLEEIEKDEATTSARSGN